MNKKFYIIGGMSFKCLLVVVVLFFFSLYCQEAYLESKEKTNVERFCKDG